MSLISKSQYKTPCDIDDKPKPSMGFPEAMDCAICNDRMVLPMLLSAKRAHLEMIDQVIRDALATAGMTMGDIDAVAATGGPGLIGGVACRATM